MHNNELENTDIQQLVSFKMGNEEFGVDILKVQEIIKMIGITKVPNAPEFVDGVINLRGRIIPVIDLRIKINMERVEHNNSTRIIVVEFNDTTTGFIVDEVNEVLRIPENIMEAPPSMVAGVDRDYIKAVCKLDDRLLILLDLERVLSFEEKKQLQEVE